MLFEKLALKCQAGKMFNYFAILALLFTFLIVTNPVPAGATNTVGDKTTAITITVNDNGTVTTAGTFTISDLQNMSQTRNIYSSFNNNIDYKFYAVEGVLLTDLLAHANVELDNIDKFTFTATDNYSRIFSNSYLLDTPRYCYPNLDEDSSTQGAIQIQPILALKSNEFLHYNQADFNEMDDYYAARLFFGQNEQDLVNDQGYVKWVDQIQVYTKVLNAEPPALTADFIQNSIDQAVYLDFTDDQDWRNAIADVTVDGTSIAGKFGVTGGRIIIDGSIFGSEKDYAVVVKANGYQDACVTQHKGAWPAIFTLDGDAVVHTYTMADLRAMPLTTGQYGPLECKGVALQDLLAAANITDSSWQMQINVTDAATFHIDPASVADLLDPANRYLLTYEIDGEPITIGPDNQTTLRIYWGIGITYKNVSGITINRPSSSTHPKYIVTPVEDATTYQISTTADGIKTMTVNSDVSGMKYFVVKVEPVTAHDGLEAVVFKHLGKGVQGSLNVTKTDFDVVNTAQVGFNVQAGDEIMVYLVDDLTNEVDFSPTVLQ